MLKIMPVNHIHDNEDRFLGENFSTDLKSQEAELVSDDIISIIDN